MKQNVLILTYWSFPDALIQTYTLPYVRMMRQNLPPGNVLYLVTLEKNPETLHGAKAQEIRGRLAAESIEWIPFQYRRFGIGAFILWMGAGFRLSMLILTKKIRTIHCWCTPAGAIGYVLALLFRKRLVIDSFEPHAEAMVENGTWSRRGLAFRLLFWLEKKQTARASALIATTAGMRSYAANKFGIQVNEFYVKPACVDTNLFSVHDKKDTQLLRTLGLTDKIVCVYAGKFGGIYFDQEVFDFFYQAFVFWGDRFKVLLLTNHSPDQIAVFCRNANLPEDLVVTAFVDHSLVPRYMGLADFAVTPVRPVPSKQYCSPIKDGEYWALGLPVVIPSNISDDSDIIRQHRAGAVMDDSSEEAYQTAIRQIDEILANPNDETYQRIRSLAENFRGFRIAADVYKKVYGNK